MKIAVIGTGYVGLVTGVVLSDFGNEVACVDNDPEKLQKLKSGTPTIFEPGLQELLQKGLSEKLLRFTDSVADAVKSADVVFIAVGTPGLPDGSPDLSALREVASEIGRAIGAQHTTVVNKSTVPVGSGDLVESLIRDQGVASELYDVVSNPEFLREGSAVLDTLRPDRIIIGAKRPEAAQKLVALYAPFNRPVLITDLNSAELIKYASNCFLATKISFINAISRLCEACDAEVGDVAKGMGLDPRIGEDFLGAGLGWGGSCLPKDVDALIATAEKVGYDFELLKAVCKINDQQTENFLRRLEERLGGLCEKRICVLGLSFKPNTDDIREAKSVEIISRLIEKGAEVCAYDPVSAPLVAKLLPTVSYADDPYLAAAGADAVLLVTEWNEFRHLDLARLKGTMRGSVLFDGRRIYPRAAVEQAGLEYHTIGSYSPAILVDA